MRLNDAVIGAVLLALSLAVLWHVKDFPAIPGQPYGAALYPTVVAAGLAITSFLLMLQGLRSGQPMLAIQPGSRGGLLAFWITVASLLFYVLFVDLLGFLLSSTIMLVALTWSYGVRPRSTLPVAIAASLIIHTGFYKLLKVPLPWGILQPIAW